MYMNHKNYIIVLLIFVLINIVNNEVLIKRGWVKYQNKGPKHFLSNVQRIDPKFFKESKYIRVSGKIRLLPRGSVRNLEDVVTLRISMCGIEEVKPGAFINLPNLATLSLMDNDIEHISAGVFNNLTISVLFLHKNKIQSIDRDAFNDMPNLYRLKVNSNQIAHWNSDWFKNTPQLTELFFRRNKIQRIPNGAFKNLNGGHYLNGTYIVDTKIYLSKNSISIIEPKAFESITDLSQIWLDRNNLIEIEEELFFHMTQIGVIFLSKNRLRKIPEKLLQRLEEDVLTLDLSYNHNLTCPSYNIVSRVKITTLKDIRKLDCNCVSELMNMLMVADKNNEIQSDCSMSRMQ